MAFVRVGFRQSRCFVDFLFLSCQFLRRSCRRNFVPPFDGERCPENLPKNPQQNASNFILQTSDTFLQRGWADICLPVAKCTGELLRSFVSSWKFIFAFFTGFVGSKSSKKFLRNLSLA